MEKTTELQKWDAVEYVRFRTSASSNNLPRPNSENENYFKRPSLVFRQLELTTARSALKIHVSVSTLGNIKNYSSGLWTCVLMQRDEIRHLVWRGMEVCSKNIQKKLLAPRGALNNAVFRNLTKRNAPGFDGGEPYGQCAYWRAGASIREQLQ